jgi:hypothetical protein
LTQLDVLEKYLALGIEPYCRESMANMVKDTAPGTFINFGAYHEQKASREALPLRPGLNQLGDVLREQIDHKRCNDVMPLADGLASPLCGNVVLPDGTIGGEQRQFFGHRLSHKHPVERIAVMQGKAVELDGMCQPNG